MVMPNAEIFTHQEADTVLWPARSAEDRLCALAHELRGRLHVLALNTNLMLDRARTADSSLSRGWLVERLDRQADTLGSMLELMERLLDVEMTEHSSEVCTLRLVDLRSLVYEILQADSESLRAARCSWSLQAPVSVSGYWDALQLRVAIRNLLNNAIKFGPGKPVDVSVGCSEDMAFVRVNESLVASNAPTRACVARASDFGWSAASRAHMGGKSRCTARLARVRRSRCAFPDLPSDR
jgi:signal transduction histidine kinase